METPSPTPGEHPQDALPARPARTPKWPRSPSSDLLGRSPTSAWTQATATSASASQRVHICGRGKSETEGAGPRAHPGNFAGSCGLAPSARSPSSARRGWTTAPRAARPALTMVRSRLLRARGRTAAASSEGRWELRRSAASEEIRPALTAP